MVSPLLPSPSFSVASTLAWATTKALPGYGPQQPQPTASPGPGNPRLGGGRFGGPATPQQNQANPYPGSPAVARPTPPPNQLQQNADAPLGVDFQYSSAELDRIGNQLSDLDPEKLPPHLKKVGDDWHAVFNPRVARRLDVELVHNLAHQSVVCCVRFSQDGRFVATGCNRSAQIYDVKTGQQVAHLQDNSAAQDGDLYIRSVCFSPDGRYLATGAEDKLIRVGEATSLCDLNMADDSRSGTSLSVASAINSRATSRTSTVLTLHRMAVTLPPGLVIEPSGSGTSRRTSASYA